MAATSSALVSASPILRRLAAIVGWLCVIATLALLSPGVVATARADEMQSPPASGPTCKAPEHAAEESMISLNGAIERIHTRALAQPGDAGDDYIVLNGRGYNYGTQPNPLEPEAESDQR
jgi:hypothetical protein